MIIDDFWFQFFCFLFTFVFYMSDITMECNDVFVIAIVFRIRIRRSISSADSNNIAVE